MSIELNQKNKHAVWSFWHALQDTDPDRVANAAHSAMDANTAWHGPDPINELRGVDSFIADFWLPLQESFPNLERQSHLFFGGKSSGRIDGRLDGNMWVCGTGFFHGTFARDYLSIPATGSEVRIRWGEFCRMDDGLIVEVFFLLDFVDLMQQAGFQVLPPSRGADAVYPPPLTNDGILLDAQDGQASEFSLAHIRQFLFEGLNSYDQSDLASMGMANFFHPDVRWYGPGGIGACFGLEEFQRFHQQPWLHAFPDRRVQDLDALFAEGCYSGAPGWAGVKATHKGQYLDCPATGAPLEINGLDYWRRDGEMYVENWVFVDMIHLFRQFGVDLFARLTRTNRSTEP